MVTHQSLHWLAPGEEPRYLGEAHPREGDGDDRLVAVPGTGAGREIGQSGDRRPTSEELQTHVPASRQLATEFAVDQKSLHVVLAAPLCEHRDATQLQPVGRQRGRPEAHQRETLGVVQSAP